MQIYVWLDQSTNKYLKVRNRDVMYLHDISFEKIEKQSKKCQQIKRWINVYSYKQNISLLVAS